MIRPRPARPWRWPWPPAVRRRLTAAARATSIRARVMAAAALLVALTSLVTGILGVTLLRGYLLGRSDAQLRNFAAVAGRVLSKTGTPPRRPAQQALPTQFLVEVVSADGSVRLAGGPLHDTGAPALTAARHSEPGGPFTAPAGDAPGDSWRVLVRPLSGGRHLVVAYGLADLNSTVARLEAADAVAGGIAVALLVVVGRQP